MRMSALARRPSDRSQFLALGCVAVAVAAAALTACGEESGKSGATAPERWTVPAASGDREQITSVIKAMQDALNRGDVKLLCTDIYAFQGSTSVDQCTTALSKALSKRHPKVRITVSSVQVHGARAAVIADTLGLSQGGRPDEQTFSLVKENAVWRVLYT